MLSVMNRLKLALWLMPSIFFPIAWIMVAIFSLENKPVFENVLIITVEGLTAALLSAYCVTSFIEYLRILRNKQ